MRIIASAPHFEKIGIMPFIISSRVNCGNYDGDDDENCEDYDPDEDLKMMYDDEDYDEMHES